MSRRDQRVLLLSGDEKAIWNAAYAAAWVSDFRATRGDGVGLVTALAYDHATVAISVANEAVLQLRVRQS
jgi:hypothetical protein